MIVTGLEERCPVSPRTDLKISSGFAERPRRSSIIVGEVGEKMTYMEYEKLLLMADRLTSICNPRKAEYWKGYRSGIEAHFQNGQQESLPDHYSIMEVARRNRSSDVHAYARGYRDGCKGLKPEDAP
jgi:hypothetical protein